MDPLGVVKGAPRVGCYIYFFDSFRATCAFSHLPYARTMRRRNSYTRRRKLASTSQRCLGTLLSYRVGGAGVRQKNHGPVLCLQKMGGGMGVLGVDVF